MCLEGGPTSLCSWKRPMGSAIWLLRRSQAVNPELHEEPSISSERSRGADLCFWCFTFPCHGSARNPRDPLRTFGLDTHITQQGDGDVVRSRVGKAERFALGGFTAAKDQKSLLATNSGLRMFPHPDLAKHLCRLRNPQRSSSLPIAPDPPRFLCAPYLYWS